MSPRCWLSLSLHVTFWPYGNCHLSCICPYPGCYTRLIHLPYLWHPHTPALLKAGKISQGLFGPRKCVCDSHRGKVRPGWGTRLRGGQGAGHICAVLRNCPTDSPETSIQLHPLGSVVRGPGQKAGGHGQPEEDGAQFFKTKSISSNDRVCRWPTGKGSRHSWWPVGKIRGRIVRFATLL